MSACDRVDAEGLADPAELDADARAHVASCAACQARHAGYARIAGAFRTLGAQRVIPSDRGARLRATLDAADAQVRRRRRGFALVGVGLAAAAVLVFWISRDEPAPPPRFEVAVLAGTGEPTRGDARLGDRLRIRARAGAAIAVRVYRNDRELVLACPAACRRAGDALIGEVALDAIAHYQVVWFDGALPASTGTLDGDVAAAAAAGARYELRELVVR